MITPMQLKAVFTYCRNPGLWCRTFGQVLPAFGIDATPQRLAMFLAQAGHESEHFNRLRENLSYQTVARLRAVFPREFPTDDAAQRYIMNPVGLGNFLYANRFGNGDVASGDGFKYRGGGVFGLTFRDNYREVGKALGLDLEVRPQQIIQEPIALKTAAYFWKLKDLNAAADAGDFDHTTRAINPGMAGADVRRGYWEKLLAVIGSATPEAAAAQVRRDNTVPVLDGVMTPGLQQNVKAA